MPGANRHREPQASKKENGAFDLNSFGLSVFPRFTSKDMMTAFGRVHADDAKSETESRSIAARPMDGGDDDRP